MLAYVVVLFAIALRFLPVLAHNSWPYSFNPIWAALLFFGARLPRKRMWIPVIAAAAADLALNSLYGYKFTPDLLISWLWYGVVVFMGGALLRGEMKPLRVSATGLAATVAFFLVSNFAVWLTWNMYPMTPGGLAACYVAGLPFFRNDLIGTPLFSLLLFSIPVLAESTGLMKKTSTI